MARMQISQRAHGSAWTNSRDSEASVGSARCMRDGVKRGWGGMIDRPRAKRRAGRAAARATLARRLKQIDSERARAYKSNSSCALWLAKRWILRRREERGKEVARKLRRGGGL
eukprot:6179049-Pleurochrysis_carterae.AAC.2